MAVSPVAASLHDAPRAQRRQVLRYPRRRKVEYVGETLQVEFVAPQSSYQPKPVRMRDHLDNRGQFAGSLIQD